MDTAHVREPLRPKTAFLRNSVPPFLVPESFGDAFSASWGQQKSSKQPVWVPKNT